MPFEKTNAPGYIKDTKEGVVINTNHQEYEQILAARQKKHESDAVKADVEQLKNDMHDIKAMLSQLLNRTA